jgi:hypothetical protein
MNREYVDLPAAAKKKDGPSGSVAMVRSPLFLRGFGAETTVVGLVQVCAIVSLFTGKYVPSYGSHDRRGAPKIATSFLFSRFDMRKLSFCRSLCADGYRRIGGIKEKVLGAHRAGANRVILPWANRKDVEYDVAKEVRACIQFAFARMVREVFDAAFGPGSLPWRAPDAHHPLVESRL